MINNLEKIKELEGELIKTQELLVNESGNKNLISQLKLQRNILGGLALLFLALLLFLTIYNVKKSKSNNFDNKNLSLIDNDSLDLYKKDFLDNAIILNDKDLNSIDNEKIIYTVQIGAFKDFYLASNSLMNLTQFQVDGYNKFSIGHYKTYAEAKKLKTKLTSLGFRDSFLVAKSFGNHIDIIDALTLSNEPEFLD